MFYLELPGLEKFTFYEVNVTASTSVGSGPEGTTVVQTESDSKVELVVFSVKEL